jgi:hypothetical protein
MAATSSSLAPSNEHIPGLGLISTPDVLAQWNLEEQAAQQNQQTQATQSSFSPTPVPVEQSVRSSENTILLYQLATKHGVEPEVEFSHADQKFRGQLKLGTASFMTEDLYSNKKDAKEAVAKLGVEYLKDLPVLQTTSPRGATGTSNIPRLVELAQKHAFPQPEWIYTEIGLQQFTAKLKVQQTIFEAGPYPSKKEGKEATAKQAVDFIMAFVDGSEEAGGGDELWSAKLYTFVHVSTGKGPEYKDFDVGRLFSSEVTIPQRQDHFGDRTVTEGSKKKARNNAAKEAVEWLRSEGLMDENDKPLKKTKSQTQEKTQSQSHSSEEGSPPSTPTKGDGKGYMQQLLGTS